MECQIRRLPRQSTRASPIACLTSPSELESSTRTYLSFLPRKSGPASKQPTPPSMYSLKAERWMLSSMCYSTKQLTWSMEAYTLRPRWDSGITWTNPPPRHYSPGTSGTVGERLLRDIEILFWNVADFTLKAGFLALIEQKLSIRP